MNPFRRLAGHGVIYGIAGIAGSLASVVLTPLYARYLGPAAYGQLETLLALIQVVTILAAFGAGSAALCLIIQPEGEPPGVPGSALAVAAGGGLFWLVAAGVGAPWLSGWLELPAAWIRLVGLCGSLTALAQIAFSVWRARGQAWTLAGFTLAQVLATLGLNIYQVAWMGRGAEGILYSLILVQVGLVLVAGWWLRDEWRQGIDWRTAWEVVSIGVTHVFNSLATWIVQLSDRFLLMSYAVAAEVGYYTLGNKISFIGQLLLASPLALAWPSYLQQMGQDKAVERQYGHLFELLTVLACGLFLFIALPAPEWALLLGGRQYAAAVPMVPVLAAAVLVNALMPVLLSGFGLAMHFRLYPLITLVSAGVNVGLNLWWIPRWGGLGAAWATLIAYLSGATLARVIAQRLWPLPIPWARVCRWLGWAGFLFLLGVWADSLAWRVLLILLYPVGFFAVRQRERLAPAPAV